jgi:hypothetical protein
MDALMWANMAQGFEEGRQRNNNQRVEAARLFNEFKKANPDANFQDYQTFIGSITGGAPWLRDALPEEQQLQAYAAANQQAKAQADRMARMEMISKQAQLSSVFERGMADNLLSTDGDTQQALERTIGAMSGGDQTIANDLRSQFGNANYSTLWQRTQSEIMDSRWDQIIQLGETGQRLTAGHLKSVLGYTPTGQQVEMANLRVNQVLEAKRERQAQLALERRNSNFNLAMQVANHYRVSSMDALKAGESGKVKDVLSSMLKLAIGDSDPQLINQIVNTNVNTWEQEAQSINKESLARFSTDPKGQEWLATLISSGKTEQEIAAGLKARGIYVDDKQVADMVNGTRTLMQTKQQSDWQATGQAASQKAVTDFTAEQKSTDELVKARLNLNTKDTEAQGVGNVAAEYAPRQEQVDEFINRVTELVKDNPSERVAAVEKVAQEMGIPRDREVIASMQTQSGAYQPTDPMIWSNTKRTELAGERQRLEQEIANLIQLPASQIPLGKVGELRRELGALKSKVASFAKETESRAVNARQWDTSFTLEAGLQGQGSNHPFVTNSQSEVDSTVQLLETFKAVEQKAQQVDKYARGQLPIEELTKDPTEQMRLVQNTQREKLVGLYRADQEGKLTMEEASKLSLILSGTRSLAIPNSPDYAGSVKKLRMLENAYINLMNGGSVVTYDRGEYASTRNADKQAFADVVSQLKKELANYR